MTEYSDAFLEAMRSEAYRCFKAEYIAAHYGNYKGFRTISDFYQSYVAR